MFAVSTRTNTLLLVLILAVGIAIVAMLASGARGGPLDPTGPPASTLPQVEPRVPIDHVPFTITQPGSYFLTRDLSGGASNGISIGASDVTLDLNGFTLRAAAGSGFAIYDAFSVNHGWVIRNGTIEGWDDAAINAPNINGARFEDLELIGIGSSVTKTTLKAGQDVVVRNVHIHGGAGDGIAVGDNADVEGNSVVAKSGAGIVSSGNFAVIKGNLVKASGANGIDVGNSSSVVGNSVIGSGLEGIVSLFDTVVIKDNLVQGSGTNGIHVFNSSDVEGNTVVGNNVTFVFGYSGILVAGTRNTIAANHVLKNNVDDIKVTGNLNLVRGNSTNHGVTDFGSNNSIGPLVNYAVIGANTYPDANFY